MIDAQIFGVKAVAGYDNSAALQAAVDFSGNLTLPEGVIELHSAVNITKYPFNWKGSNTTFKAVGTQDSVINFQNVGGAWDGIGSKIEDITFSSDNSTTDQHGIKISKSLGEFNLSGVEFNDITGYGIAFDTINLSTGTTQNISISNTSFRDVGGCIGLTSEPADSASFLAVTLLSLDNVNLDNGINSVSPQPFMFDFRAMRHINATNLLTEGSNVATGTDTVMALASNGYVNVDGWHNEFTTFKPDNLVKVFADPLNKFYGLKGPNVNLSSVFASCMCKLAAEDGTDPHFTVNGWQGYNETSIDDIVDVTITTANKGPSFDFHNLSVKTPFQLPMNKRGYINVHSFRSADIGGTVNVLPAKIASWRPSMGSLVQFESAYFSPEVVTVSASSSAIEPDTENDRLMVERFTGVTGANSFGVPQVKFGLELEPSWIGSKVTVVVRYKLEVDAADLGESTHVIYPNGERAGTVMSINTAGVYNEWVTGIQTFEPSVVNPKPLSRYINTGITVPTILRIAAVDVYLGSGYSEPLDLDGAV